MEQELLEKLERLKQSKSKMESELEKNKGSNYPMGRSWYDDWYNLLDEIQVVESKLNAI